MNKWWRNLDDEMRAAVAALTAMAAVLLVALGALISGGETAPSRAQRERSAYLWLAAHRQVGSTVECDGYYCTVVPATGNPLHAHV